MVLASALLLAAVAAAGSCREGAGFVAGLPEFEFDEELEFELELIEFGEGLEDAKNGDSTGLLVDGAPAAK